MSEGDWIYEMVQELEWEDELKRREMWESQYWKEKISKMPPVDVQVQQCKAAAEYEAKLDWVAVIPR